MVHKSLRSYLKNKEMLLVLDNLEHLLSGIQLVGELLEHAPHIKLLATSRERLNLQAEWVYDLFGLEVPEAANQAAQDCDAIKLFAQRASSVRHDFILESASLPTIVHICQLVRGMPLAIELAASWLRVLTLKDIAVEIEKGIFFLEASARDIPARHRSIRAVFDYSWHLLMEEEQAVLRKLAVFRGGFRREAAAEVAGATLSILSSLVDKSFLTLTLTGRYRRHPLVLQYTREKLSEHPEEKAQVEERHGLYYLNLAREKVERLKGVGWKETAKDALAVLDEERANIRVAWRWAVEHERVEVLRQNAQTIAGVYGNQEALELFAFAASHLSSANPHHQAALGHVLIELAFAETFLGRQETATNTAEQGLALVRTLKDDEGILRGLYVMAGGKWNNSDFWQSKLISEEGLGLARRLGNEEYISGFLANLALVLKEFDDLPNVDKFYEEGLIEIQQLNPTPLDLAMYLHYYGFYLLHNGDIRQAQALERESLDLFLQLNIKGWQAGCVDGLGVAAFKLGKFDEAETLLHNALALAEEGNFQFLRAYILSNLAKVVTMKGNHAKAEQYLKESFEIGLNIKNTWSLLATLVSFAELHISQGQLLKAAGWLAFASHHPGAERHDRMEAQRVLEGLQYKLSDEELKEALERGRRMKLEEVVEELLGTL